MPNEVVLAPSIDLPPHGLVATGNVIEDDGGRWENGITFTQEGCYRIHGDCVICNDGGQRIKSAFQECQAAAVFKPYLLDLGILWNTPDRFDVKESTRRQLLVGTSARLESLSWVGCTGLDNPLLSEGTNVGSGTAIPAIAAVSDAIATGQGGLRIGGQGTLYMSYANANTAALNLTVDEDGKLRTKIGHHRVVVGDFPDSAIAGHLGDVDVYISDIFLTESPGETRARNEIAYRVERMAMAVWSPCATYVATVS